MTSTGTGIPDNTKELERGMSPGSCELSIVMPCLDEAETLATCITKARLFLDSSGVSGEIVVADNGSTDGSQAIALEMGARVVDVPSRGYGNALLGGIGSSLGEYVIMGDADDSYDFTALEPFLVKLRNGYDLVIGNRFKGGIEQGAMPPLHRYVGNPILSGIGRLFFHSPVGDFHCGLRGFNREAIESLDLQTGGMEFASEMVVKATLNGLSIAEVPTTLSPDGRSGRAHLRSWSDGWRHLRFLLALSPRWLFLYPGIVFIALGAAAMAWWAVAGPIKIGSIGLGINTMLFAVLLIVLGVQLVYFGVLSKILAARLGVLPRNKSIDSLLQKVTLERGLIVGGAMCLLGIVGYVVALVVWGENSFGALVPGDMTRLTIPAVTLIIVGFQTVFSSFFLAVIGLHGKGD